MTILAIDAGTSAIKAAVISDDGAVVAVGRESVAARASVGNDPMVYWHHVVTAIQSVSAEARTADAIAVTGQGDGLWTIDHAGLPAGPAYEWNSSVSAGVVRGWEQDGTIEEHYRRGATVLWSGTSAALWKWLQLTDPEHCERTQHAFCAKDWINYQLCGAIATDVSDATIPFLDLDTGSYSPTAIESLGCSDLIDKLAPIQPHGARLGNLSTEAAQATGLVEGTPVLMGCVDGVALVYGAGLERPGDALGVLGTTAAALVLTESLDRFGETVGATLRLQEDGLFLRFMGSSSGTGTLDWYRKTIGSNLDEFWDDVALGSPGVTMLPYLSGERVPFLAPDATGTFFGLRPSTGRPELARAVAHGITHSLRHCLDAAGGSDGPIVLTGGGSSSSQWCQLVADVTQREVHVDDRPHVACVGLATLVTGRTTPAVGERATYEPKIDLTPEYESFVSLGQQLRPIWSEQALTERTGES